MGEIARAVAALVRNGVRGPFHVFMPKCDIDREFWAPNWPMPFAKHKVFLHPRDDIAVGKFIILADADIGMEHPAEGW